MGACAAPTVTVRTGVPAGQSRGNDRATEQFTAVARQVEPVANDVCRQIRPRSNCDFLILIDERQGLPVNAFQTTDRRGRPYLVFTRAIVDEFRNADEMAFVISHEAAHHIENHLYERAQSAQAAEVIFEAAAAASGASVAGQATAAEYGRLIGSRVYSKQFELEADALGTVIAKRAGFDPVRGAMFFARLPDPGDQFLGTHPPNAARIGVVQQVAAQLP
ncbi:MAG: M48 family metallopeptidase [Mangrovicoccus sp.]|nr:M48 family metallopeptidase [Mangrovicoccus sp.]